MPIDVKTTGSAPLSTEAKTRIQSALKATLASELAKEGGSKGVGGKVAWKAETSVHGKQIDESVTDR